MRSSMRPMGARQDAPRGPALRALQRVQQREPDDDLVPVVAQAHAVGPFVLLEVPGVAGQAVVAREDLLHVGVTDPLRPLQEAAVAGHGGEAHEGLQHVAVELRARVRQLAERALDGRVLHEGRRHVRHPVEPGRTAEQLGDREQAVLRVLGRAEETGRPELARLELEVAGDAVAGVGVFDLAAQHVAQAPVVQRAVGEEGGGHEVRIVVGAGVVRRVEVHGRGLSLDPGQVVGKEQRPFVGVGEPGLHHAARAAEDLLGAHAVLGGLLEERIRRRRPLHRAHRGARRPRGHRGAARRAPNRSSLLHRRPVTFG